MNRVRATAAIVFGGIVAASQGQAQEYPKAPVHIVSGFSAGSTADATARIIGAKMGELLGQQFVIENRVGAGSSIAAASVARGPADGYTLLVGSAANVINGAISSNLSFDFTKDFTPVTLLTSTPTVLVVNPGLGVKSVRELIALAQAKPDAILFGSSGVGSSTHLALELFKHLAQVKITHVPYGGSPPVVTDLLAERINGYFAPASGVMEHVAAGKLVALAVTDAKRSTILPDLPTMIEAGVPGFESVLWFGLVAPTGTPQPIVDKLAASANQALASDDIGKRLSSQFIATIGGSPQDFARYIAAEQERWTTVVTGAGLKK